MSHSIAGSVVDARVWGAGVVGLARQVIESSNRGEKAQAVLKLFATLSQAKWVTQQGLMEEWSAIYLGILQARLLHTSPHPFFTRGSMRGSLEAVPGRRVALLNCCPPF